MIRNFILISFISLVITYVCSLPTLSRQKRWEEFPNVTFTFDCTDRPMGLYADMEFDCTLFHYCDADGIRIPFMCGNRTAFNQEIRNCDWKFNVNCQDSEKWFYLNALTYREDSSEEKYDE